MAAQVEPIIRSEPKPRGDVAGQGAALFVSSALATWRTNTPDTFSRDFQINHTVYRRLDPEYYAWLRSRMQLGKLAAAVGHISQESFDDLRLKFNRVHEWAIEGFGEAQLLTAMGSLRASSYEPPHSDGVDQAPPAEPTPSKASPEAERIARAAQLVDVIRDEALALGWTTASLYFCKGYERRPIGPRYGLVCYIGQEQRIGEVTRQSIELVGPAPGETRMRFYNPDVEQPWIVMPSRPE